MKYAFFILSVFCLNNFTCAETPVIEVQISTVDDDTEKKLEGAVISVFQDGKKISDHASAATGKVPVFKLPINYIYQITFAKKGYVSKIAEINAITDHEENMPAVIYAPMKVGLFKKKRGQNFGFLRKEPMIKFYLTADGICTYDKEYTATMLQRIEEIRNSK